MNTTQVFEKRKIAVAIGIDLAKDHCDVVAYNADNKVCFSKANMSFPKLISGPPTLVKAKCLSFFAEGDAGARMRSRSGRGPY